MISELAKGILNQCDDQLVMIADQEGRIVFHNGLTSELINLLRLNCHNQDWWAVEELEGMSLAELLPWLSLDELQQSRVELKDAEGQPRVLDVKVSEQKVAKKRYTAIILKDLTAKVRLQKDYEELVSIKGKYEYALESLFDGVIIADREGRVVYINKAQEKLDNIKKEDAINKPATEVFNLDNETSVIMQAIITKKDVPDQNQYYINMVGQAVNIVTYAYPLLKDGEVVGAVAICRDTTKMKDFAEKILRDRNRNSENNQVEKSGARRRKKVKRNYYNFSDLIGNNSVYREAIRWAQVSAQTDSSVLIYGLTGTGKELFAQSIHSHSKRKDGPFIGINCAALPESLLEGILFGTVKGAFTGAIDRPGLFEQAHGGTLFLDELNSMTLGLQAKLLRVLQDGTYRRVGGSEDMSVNVRLISSLNTDPNKAVAEGVIRQDLFYRLAVVVIRIPTLHERKDDIPMLTSYFIGKHNQKLDKDVQNISPEVMDYFLNYYWPGNVRELEHVLECAMVVMEDESYIKLEHLPQHLAEGYIQQYQDDHLETNSVDNLVVLDDQLRRMHGKNGEQKRNYALKRKLDNTEKELIKKILGETRGNVSKTARILGISRQSLQYRLKKYDIDRSSLL